MRVVEAIRAIDVSPAEINRRRGMLSLSLELTDRAIRMVMVGVFFRRSDLRSARSNYNLIGMIAVTIIAIATTLIATATKTVTATGQTMQPLSEQG